MKTLFFRNQWKTTMYLMLSFFVILLFYNRITSTFDQRYTTFQSEYIRTQDTENREQFFLSLERDSREAEKIVQAIEHFEGYGDGVQAENRDPVLEAAGIDYYADYDMLRWKEEMLRAPGKYSETVEDDYLLLMQLSQRLGNEKNLVSHVENNKELALRGMRRNDPQYIKYMMAYEQLKNIRTEFVIQDPVAAEKFLGYFENDIYLIIVFALSFFSVFSNLIQNKMSNQILLSKTGMRRFAFSQTGISAMTAAVWVWIYYGAVLLIFCGGRLGNIPWDLPIQAINGYETVCYAFTVGQYIFFSVLLKTGYCVFTTLIFLLLSVLSKNNIISAFMAFVYCGGVYAACKFLSQREAPQGNLLLGSAKYLFSDFPYLCLGTHAVPWHLCWLALIIALSMLLVMIIVLVSKVTAKRWAL